MNIYIIPYFIINKEIDLISNEDFQKCIDTANDDRSTECVYVVIKMLLEYARIENNISSIRTINKPKKKN